MVLVFCTKRLSDIHIFCIGSRTSFSPDLPILQGNIAARGTAKGRALLTVFCNGPSNLAFRNPKTQENINEEVCHLLKHSIACETCELEESNEDEELGVWTNSNTC